MRKPCELARPRRGALQAAPCPVSKRGGRESAAPCRGWSGLALLTVAGWLLAAGTLRAAVLPEAANQVSKGTLSFAERVAYQRAIEEVLWRHRIWPKENPGSKPSLDGVMSAAQLEKRVGDYLRRSEALSGFWGRPLEAAQLQAEMERMAQQSRQPEVLRELFAALGQDPFVIAECLARPALAERVLSNWYGYDQRIHGELKERAEAELRLHPGAERMKQLSGQYREMEYFKSARGDHRENTARVDRERTLTRGEWDETLQKLAGITIGKLSALREDELCYYTTAVLEKSEDRVTIATVTWPKESLESWVAKAENQTLDAMAMPGAAYTLPQMLEQAAGCDDSWTSTAIQSPGRSRHTTVWTGSEMIVWGGAIGLNVFSNTGSRYTPSTDSWAATSTFNAPTNRADLTAVWTGREMIVWGGDTPGVWFDTGGRYNPGADSWISTNTANAPEARGKHTAVWTGSEMIVWGGYFQAPPATDRYVNTGGRYNPYTDSWTATNTANAPAGRDSHTAIWTGTEMIVWGGAIANSQWVNTGGRYNATTDSWIATSTANVPSARADHTAIWTGSEMIVWGGFTFSSQTDTGGRYNPSADSWTATSIQNSPTRRWDHATVWTGNEMIVWGGFGCTGSPMCQSTTYLNTGASYDPSTDGWVAMTTTNAPTPRESPTAVWTGREMIVWGGFFYDGSSHYLNTGGRYCAQPSAPIVQGAVSRKTHGSVGTFEVDLPLSGTPGIEGRSGGATGDYTIVITFLANVSVNGNPQAAVTSGIGTIGSGGTGNGGMVLTSGNVLTIPLTNVANAQTIQVTLSNVNGSTNVTIPMGVLTGDSNGSGAVNATDVSLVKSRSGQSVDATSFRLDGNVDGSINSTDVSLVKASSGMALP